MFEGTGIILPSFSSPMLSFLTAVFATLSSVFRSRSALQLENLALRHQMRVLQRVGRKRPKLMPRDRLLWIWLSRIWSGWRSALGIVKPENSFPGIASAFSCSGLGRCAAADRDDPSFLARFEI